MVVRIMTDTQEEMGRYLIPLHERWGNQVYGLEIRLGLPSTIVVYDDAIADQLMVMVDGNYRAAQEEVRQIVAQTSASIPAIELSFDTGFQLPTPELGEPVVTLAPVVEDAEPEILSIATSEPAASAEVTSGEATSGGKDKPDPKRRTSRGRLS